jgi:hypothetical protein
VYKINAESSATETPYFDLAHPQFSLVSYDTRANHPDHYKAKATETNLMTDYLGVYGLEHKTDTLDFNTGTIHHQFVSHAGGNSEGQKDLLPPDLGGNYFEYVDELAHMKGVIEVLECQGLVSGSSAVLGKALSKIQSLENIDAIRITRMDFTVLKGRRGGVAVELHLAADRDILVSVCASESCFASEKITVTRNEIEKSFTFAIPAELKESTALTLKLDVVGVGIEGSQAAEKLSSSNKDFIVQPFESVNLYASYSLKPGQPDKAYFMARSEVDATIEMRIYDSTGKEVAKSSESVAAADDSALSATGYIKYVIDSSATVGTAKVVTRLYKRDASWESFMTEEVKDVVLTAP